MFRPLTARFRVTATLCFLTLACVALNRTAQTRTAPAGFKPAPNPQETKLPGTIRLVLRGKVGDTYVLKSSSHGKWKMNIHVPGNGVRQDTRSEKEDKTLTWRVRSIMPQGNLKIENRTVSGQKTEEQNGKRITTPSALKAYLETYAPNNKRVSRVSIAQALPKSASKGKAGGKALKPAPTEDNDSMSDPTFPDKALRVGDTWSGTIPFKLKSVTDKQNLEYKAKLVAIETHLNVPCAKVEYAFTLNTLNTTELSAKLTKKLPPNAKIKGEMKLTGTQMVYYSLDRSAGIETSGSITAKLHFLITAPNPNTGDKIEVVIEGNIEFGGIEVATKIPPYDPSLMVSPVSRR